MVPTPPLVVRGLILLLVMEHNKLYKWLVETFEMLILLTELFTLKIGPIHVVLSMSYHKSSFSIYITRYGYDVTSGMFIIVRKPVFSGGLILSKPRYIDYGINIAKSLKIPGATWCYLVLPGATDIRMYVFI